MQSNQNSYILQKTTQNSHPSTSLQIFESTKAIYTTFYDIKINQRNLSQKQNQINESFPVKKI